MNPAGDTYGDVDLLAPQGYAFRNGSTGRVKVPATIVAAIIAAEDREEDTFPR